MPRNSVTTSLLLVLPLAGGLLNTTIFGSPSLTAYFGFVLPSLCCLLIFSVKAPRFIPLPPYKWAFLGLVLYICLHGLISDTINLTHYYWAALGLWLLACHQVKNGLNKGIMGSLSTAITLLACLESVLVVLQAIGWVPALNRFFPCTGSWENPNVTAIFLAMSLFSVLQLARRMPERITVYISLLLVLVAIGLLRCRSAYLVSALFLAVFGWEEWKKASVTTGRGRSVVVWILLSAVFLSALAWLTFDKKEASTVGRGRIWKHSLELAGRRPVSGYGFGLFGREYNLMAAKERWPGTEPVSMPYNDFIELGVEGGAGAVAGWVLFLCLLIRHQLRRRISVLPAVGLLLAQLTNFVFQNIPAFGLFLLYTALDNFQGAEVEAPMKRRPVVSIALSVLSMCLLVAQLRLAYAFSQVGVLVKEDERTPAAYEAFYSSLYNAPYYLEHLGDARMAAGQYADARRDYAQAMHYSMHESLLGKTGYCYQREGRYDSSEYFFTLLQNVAPARFSPRMALLAMYRQKGDTASMLTKATEIVNMPVKVPGGEEEKIKAYAKTLLNQFRK